MEYEAISPEPKVNDEYASDSDLLILNELESTRPQRMESVELLRVEFYARHSHNTFTYVMATTVKNPPKGWHTDNDFLTRTIQHGVSSLSQTFPYTIYTQAGILIEFRDIDISYFYGNQSAVQAFKQTLPMDPVIALNAPPPLVNVNDRTTISKLMVYAHITPSMPGPKDPQYPPEDEEIIRPIITAIMQAKQHWREHKPPQLVLRASTRSETSEHRDRHGLPSRTLWLP